MNFLLGFLKWLLWPFESLRCKCCGTKTDVSYFGYAGTEYCYPCAEEHGYWSSKWKHVCEAKK